jgi:hypothetical protein
MCDSEPVQFVGALRGCAGGVGHLLSDRDNVHPMTDERCNFLPRIGKSRTSGLDGDMRSGRFNGVTKIVADGNSQVSIKVDGAAEIETVMLALSSEGAGKFQALFLKNQAGDTRAHLADAEQQHSDGTAFN